jgi:purine-binding chemotaxis protein CheW
MRVGFEGMWRERLMDAVSQIGRRAAQLRRNFDSSFANPRSAESETRQDLLAIRLGTKKFAIRLSEIAGLYADKKITPVPGAAAGMLGIAGFRGSILPVYDLQVLLDLSGGSALRWLIVAAGAPVAFSFEAFDEQLRVSPGAIKRERGRAKSGFTREFTQTDGVLRPIIQLSSVLDAITA